MDASRAQPELQHLLHYPPGDELGDSLISAHTTSSTDLEYNEADAPEGSKDSAFLHLEPIALTQLDARYETSKYEFWAYCSWFVGNSGVALYGFAPVAFQSLLSQAAGTAGLLPFGGRERTVSSIVLLCNGISFCIQVAVFLVAGSFADFGTWRPNFLIVLTVIAIAIGFSWLGVHTPDQWQSAVGLYIIGMVACTVGYAFWTAAFVGLARNNPALRRQAAALKAGDISRDEYDRADSLTRSKYFNVAQIVVAPTQVLLLAVSVGILYSLDINKSDVNKNWGISVIIAFASAVSVAFSLPWFILEKRRPGLAVPAGMNIVKAGLWQWWRTGSQVWRLKQTLFYLIGYFLLTDSFYTAITVVTTLQNQVVEYDMIKLSYLSMLGWAMQFVGIYFYWYVQHRFHVRNKTVYCWVVFCIILLDFWGLLGIWTQKIGFHNAWEFWLFQGWWGFISAYYTYSQIMISEVTPRGKEFLFFSFFNLLGTTTNFFGPVISSAIIDTSSTRNTSLTFYFTTAVTVTSFLWVWLFVDPDTSQKEQAAFLEDERANRERLLATRTRRRTGEGFPD
ncbi:hypothetical protein MMC07_001935 [Pseudocyphellaria aurata]|nr:hypothetical protein [Pseudocyphellaria aurata]